ncbi:MAG: hypothetical protein ACI81G_001624, partial [Gammaproteobacteria bacterium]
MCTLEKLYALSISFILAILFSSCNNNVRVEQNGILVDTIPEIAPTLLYGIAVDSFDVYQGKVKWHQNISEILQDFNISNEKVYALANASKPVFDVRKLKAKSSYIVIHERDSLKTARQFIFEPDKMSYVIFNLADSISVNRYNREVITVEKELMATINSSLYEAILE